MTPPVDDELGRLVAELTRLFAEEREAIAALDHARLDALLAPKQALTARLVAVRDASSARLSDAHKQLLETVRIEARATALLAAGATDAVRALLGYEPTNHYDRRARTVTQGPSRILAAY